MLVFLCQQWLLSETGSLNTDKAIWIIVLLVLFHGVLFVWQIVGVIRAAERWTIETGVQVTVWGVYLSLVILFWLSMSYVIEGWQATVGSTTDRDKFKHFELEQANQYQIYLDPAAAHRLHIVGLLARGITRRVANMLETSSAIDEVVLDSQGGNIHEARGLAMLIRDNGLATRVEKECASACTIAFIGGNSRTVTKGARLGFHQYRIDAGYTVLVADPAGEQARDQSLFIDAGVSADFVETMFRQRASDMWWPTIDELLRAGVVNYVAAQ